MMRPIRISAMPAAAFLALWGVVLGDPAAAGPIAFGDAFWKQWGDGQGEVSGYEITFPRYGQIRKGTAVAVFVTETFSNELRVKADAGKHPESDLFPVMKLNLVQDFSTGIYDYNLMTSAFVALAPVNGLPAGTPTKVSFSAQEWCGQVYSQLVVDEKRIRFEAHSYFDGEADQDADLPLAEGLLLEDSLLPWARGFALPALNPGETVETEILKSLRVSRTSHTPVERQNVRLMRAAGTSSVTVPAGTFVVEEKTAAIDSGRTWTFQVEAAEPHRLIRWTCSDGESAVLLGSARLKYWEMNGPGLESNLAKIGLSPRLPRMP